MRNAAFLAAAFAAAVTAAPDAGAQTVLRFGWWGSPEAHFNKIGAFRWGEQVEEATEGRVRVEFLASPPGSPVVFHDLIRDRVIDAGYYIPGIAQGRFVLHQVAEFPFLGDSAEANSVAYWRIYKTYLEPAGEHSEVVVVTASTHGPGMIHNARRPVESAADLAGLKMRVPGATIGRLADSLGATAMFVPFTEVTQVLSSGVVDGIFVPYNAIADMSLARYLPYTTEVPGGIYNLVFHFAINREAWNEISEADRAAIMAVSGEAGARMIGHSWDVGDREGREYVLAQGVKISRMSPQFRAEIEAAFAPIRAEWAAKAAGLGIDGEAVMAAFQAEVAKLNAELEGGAAR
ncbi:MAG: ABC transporter substrate-binding protein [Paracoccaceae bacterium]|nr:MAG: ABC transporter substrate-binding protein [Paracoccaceae bacterium]